MPSVQILVDDWSAPMTYLGTWSQSAPVTGWFQSSYSQTTAASASMSYSFVGSSVTLYGKFEPAGGSYTVTVDSASPSVASQAVSDVGILFSSKGLDPTVSHTVTITNDLEGAGLVLDYLVYEADVGGSSDKLVTTKTDDAAGEWVYGPVGYKWDAGGATFLAQTYNATLHGASNLGCSITIPFEGNSIQVFGGLDPTHGTYSVVLDEGLTQTINSSILSSVTSNAAWQPQKELFSQAGLTDGSHKLVLTLLDNKFFDIDYAVVNSSIPSLNTMSSSSSQTGSSSAAASSSTIPTSDANPDTTAAGAVQAGSSPSASLGSSSLGSASTSSKGGSHAAVIGGVIAAVVVLILLGLLAFFLRRRSTKRRVFLENDLDPVAEKEDEVQSPPEPSHPAPFVYHTPGTVAYQDTTLGSSSALVDVAPHSPSSPSSSNGPNSRRISSLTQLIFVSLESHKTPAVIVSPERRRVSGREQDAGPLVRSTADQREELEDDDEPVLPPDYGQATEPLNASTTR